MSTYYANINNSYITSGNGTSSIPVNIEQLSDFVKGLSAIDSSYVTSGDIIRIKGNYITSANFDLTFNEISASINITSWENKIPWGMQVASGGSTPSNDSVFIDIENTLENLSLIIEDGKIYDLYIAENAVSNLYTFNNCIMYHRVVIDWPDSVIFNGCTFNSANNTLRKPG